MNGLKLKISSLSIIKVLKRPAYFLLAAVAAISTAAIILWSLNIEVLWLILSSPALGALDKAELILDIISGVFLNFTSLEDSLIAIFSTLFGINLAVLVFVLRRHSFRSIPKKSGFGGFLLAIIGGGCLACGTSIFAPLLASLGGAGAGFFRDFSVALNITGSLLILYSIYKLGILISLKARA